MQRFSTRSILAWTFLLPAAVFMAGCGSVSIVRPSEGESFPLPTPVTIEVTIGADRSSHRITLVDATRGTSQDLINGPNRLTQTVGVNAPDRYAGMVTLQAGTYRLEVEGVNRNNALQTSRTFDVTGSAPPSPSLSISGPIALDAGAATAVTVTRSSSGSGAATVTLAASPPNIITTPGTVAFGATSTSAQFNVTGVTAGTTSLTATAPGHTASAPVTVNVRQPMGGWLLYRSHATGVETYRFTPGSNVGTFQRVGSTPSSMSPGLQVVGLDLLGPTLLRSGSQGFEAYTVGGTPTNPTLTLSASAPTTGQGSVELTGAGTTAVVASGAWVRGVNLGIETWQPGSGTLVKAGSSNQGGAGTAGQALLADPNYALVLRSTPSSLETWDISSVTTPVRVVNNTSVFTSQTVPGIAWVRSGQQLVRSYANGIQLIDVNLAANPPTMTLGGHNGTGGGTFGAVAVARNGTVVARATGQGLEFYALWPTAAPTRCGISNQGNSAAAGVAVTARDNWVFRSTPTSIEAYDVSSLTCAAVNSTTAVTLPIAILNAGVAAAPTGLGLAGPQ